MEKRREMKEYPSSSVLTFNQRRMQVLDSIVDFRE
jgi:hypothetical protein